MDSDVMTKHEAMVDDVVSTNGQQASSVYLWLASSRSNVQASFSYRSGAGLQASAISDVDLSY